MFSEIDRWNPSSFSVAQWNWPPQYVKSLASVLERKQSLISNEERSLSEIRMATLHFDGSLEFRDTQPTGIKGSLYLAQPGDVVFSKIDVRNGAIGVVPNCMPNLAFTSEFPIYHVKSEFAIPQYIKLLFQTSYFRRTINSMVSGASGRKRIQPAQLEIVEVPIPPLQVQHTIVEKWNNMEKSTNESEEIIKRKYAESIAKFERELGLNSEAIHPMRKVFVVNWSSLENWNARSYLFSQQKTTHLTTKYPVVTGRDCLSEVRHGCSSSPSSIETGLQVLKISAVTQEVLDLTQRKYIFDDPRFREQFDLKQGDVLLCRTNGTFNYVGMGALVWENIPDTIFPDKVIRVRTKENMIPEYLWVLLKTDFMRTQIQAACRTAVGNYAIGWKNIWEFHFPLPPIAVQQRLVKTFLDTQKDIEARRTENSSLKINTSLEIEAVIMGTKRLA